MADLFETGLCAALELSTDGTILRANRGWAEILVWPADEVEGRALASLCREGQRERLDKALSNLAKGAPSAIVRARFPHGRDEHELMVRLEPAGDRVLAVAEDVGVRTAVLPRSSQLQPLVDFANDAWFVHDLDGRIRDANPAAYETLGYTREELLALTVSDIEKTIEPGRMDGVWNRMEVGKAVQVRGCHVRKDGSEKPVDVQLGLFTTEDDEVLMLAVARDVTEQRAQEAKMQELASSLRELNEHLEVEVAARAGELKAVVDSLADGLYAEDVDSRIHASNPALMDMLGLGSVPDGRPVAEVMPVALHSLGRDCLAHDEVRQVELALPGDRTGLAVASPVRDVDSALKAVVLIRDVTLEKEIDRMKTNFIAMVSHELRTPLTSVLGFAKLTRNKLQKSVLPALPEDAAKARRGGERVLSNLDIIVAEGERLTHLIGDVLDIAKMEAGRMEWRMTKLDPSPLLERAEKTCRPLFDSGDVGFELDLAPGLPEVMADTDRLLQVILNLVSNAAKFTQEGAVRLVARPVPGGLEIAVEDTGEGIDAALHESVFEKFKQVGDTLTGKPQGTGLGLPICKQIVEAHGGRLTVQSVPGEGSRFAFVIPALEGQALPSVPPPAVDRLVQRIEREALHRGAAGRDILVVDDDASLRELLRQQLEDKGFSVRLAQDGYQAIAAVRARRPDLVILDVMMPGLSGFDVAAMLKNDPSTESIPILILTIVADEERGLRLGVDRYLHKPMEADHLVGTVEELLAHGESTRRVLVVDKEQSASSDVTRLLRAKGYDVVGTVSGKEDAIVQAREHRPDLILVEALVDDHADLVRAIRFERDLEHVLVVQLMGEDEEA